MDQNQFQEDVQFIKKMMENNRRSLVDNGLMFISTGIYVIVGSVISYFLGINGRMDLVPTLWMILMAILIVVNFLIGRKKEKQKSQKNFASEMFNATWLACGLPIGIISVAYFMLGNIALESMFFVIASILGIAYYLTGVINGLKFMKILAGGWWVGALVTLFWQYIGELEQLSIFFAFLIAVLEVVPGIMIYNKWKRVYNG